MMRKIEKEGREGEKVTDRRKGEGKRAKERWHAGERE